MPNSKLYFLHSTFFLILALSLLMVSCNSSPKPKTGSLSGRVVLVNDTGDPSLDPVDYSGATVALYNLAYLDTTLVRINQEYPQVGVQISQETEFDHRLQNHVFSTTTDPEGDFELTGIEVGTYNIAVKKTGWGVKYYFNVTIQTGINDLIENYHGNIGESTDRLKDNLLYPKADVALYPAIVLASVIQNSFIFRADHTYRIASNLTVVSPVTIEGGAVILVDPGIRVDFHSEVAFVNDGKLWWITSSYGIYEDLGVPDSSEERFSSVSYSGIDGVSVSNGKITHIQNGITINGDSSSLSNLVCRDGGIAIVANANDFSVSECLFSDFADRTINIFGDSFVSLSVFYKNHDNLIITEAICEVADNYFCDNWLGIRPIYGTISIHNNEFSGNRWAISTIASSPLIQFNNFYESARYCIQTQINYVQGFNDYSNPVIRSNNFFKTSGIVVSLRPDAHEGYYNSGWVGVSNDIDAKSNYWKATIVADVIFDTLDSDQIHFAVMHVPRLNNTVPSAGIR